MALVIILAVSVAIVALNGTKASTPAATSGFGHGPGDWYYTAPAAPAVGAPPIGYDHGSSSGEIQWGQSVTNVPFYDHGWSSATTYELPSTLGQDDPKPVSPENTGSRPRNQ
jgi:hypothetical protein